MDYNLCDISAVRQLLKRYGFTFSKALGQNFIIDGAVCPAMAEALCADAGTGVVEIGPGIGVLTKELCQRAGRVCAVELDRRLVPLLEETLGDYDNFTLIEGDAMQLDFDALIRERFAGMREVKICANLPYYITSPLIMRLLEHRLPVSEIVVMVQKEAAERLCAEEGTREASAVSIAVQYYGQPEMLFAVGRDCFMPSPKVDSSVIRIRLYEQPPYDVDDEQAFFAFVRGAFSQRRKTLVNALSASLSVSKEAVSEALASLSLNPAARAENLTMEDFVGLYHALRQA